MAVSVPGWRRRDVLRAGLLTASAGSAARLSAVSEWLTADVPDPLELAFVLGSAELEDLDSWPHDLLPEDGSEGVAGAVDLIPAVALDGGDPELAGGSVRLTVHGLYPRLRRREWPDFRRISLSAILPTPAGAPEETVRVELWSSSRTGGVLNEASSLACELPIGADGVLTLDLEVEQRRRLLLGVAGSVEGPGGDGASASSAASGVGGPVDSRPVLGEWGVDRFRSALTVDGWRAQPKLTRGLYLLSVAPHSLRSPRSISAGPLARIGRCLLIAFESVD
ncbi:MAG: hypothetical protein DWQ36_25890 [Acidobacteria bacterium]|nr:MAG: hypothetical protein DWQ30_17715 [Acidobacteriota bacterium]REJ99443.1 MAG: hypothetical protein DWQ36_25890 [Acidobacteriota bacterium]